ncbi:MAG: competence protein ComEA [Bacteroidia bacterium]|jgi:competence protein ComEA
MSRDFLQFTIPEQRGVAVLLLLLGASIAARFWPWKNTDTTEIIWVEEEGAEPIQVRSKQQYRNEKRVWNLSQFDINYSKARDLRQLGFPDAFISTWFKRKQDNGFIKSKDQFHALNLLSESDYATVEPYLNFSRYTKTKSIQQVSAKKVIYLDINNADSTELKSLPGIGNKLSKRIVKFRDRLGGFHSTQQLREVYGIDSMLYERIEPLFHVTGHPNRLNINAATVEELQLHPYISYKHAKSIVYYRNQHGVYIDVDALKAIYSMDSTWVEKVKPYIKTD